MDIRTYVVSVILCALGCKILSRTISATRRKALLRLVFGAVLGITLLRPLCRIDWNAMGNFPDMDQFSADRYITEGENAAMEAQTQSIIAACETYILDKAKALGAEITVHVSLNEDRIPVLAVIHADADPNVQMQLENILMTDLGIPKENQTWIWNQESSSS